MEFSAKMKLYCQWIESLRKICMFLINRNKWKANFQPKKINLYLYYLIQQNNGFTTCIRYSIYILPSKCFKCKLNSHDNCRLGFILMVMSHRFAWIVNLLKHSWKMIDTTLSVQRIFNECTATHYSDSKNSTCGTENCRLLPIFYTLLSNSSIFLHIVLGFKLVFIFNC